MSSDVSEHSGKAEFQPTTHMIGIGGTGMSALARLLVENGVCVTGSDAQESDVLQELRQIGVRIMPAGTLAAIDVAERVIFSSAVAKNNPELINARLLGRIVISRPEALADFARFRECVCIAGSHGKTTTAAMLAFVLEQNGLDPGYMIGARVPALSGVNARVGTGPFIMEACEAFGALQYWKPRHCIVTNIDNEHVEHYGGQRELIRAFEEFIDRVPTTGTIGLCGDDAGLLQLGASISPRAVSFGLTQENTISAEINRHYDFGTSFTVRRTGRVLGSINLHVPGEHNVRNALGAFVLAETFGLRFSQISEALEHFRGAERRYQLIGESSGIRIIDDFAHHPAEIAAVLKVAAQHEQTRGKVVVVIEPQLHSRVRRLADSFAKSLSLADVVILMPIDPVEATADSLPADGLLLRSLESVGVNFLYKESELEIVRSAKEHLTPGDTLLTLGPGKVKRIGPKVLQELHPDLPTSSEKKELPFSVFRGKQRSIFEDSVILGTLKRNANISPGSSAVQCGSVTLSYQELERRANRLAMLLAKMGIAKEDVVAVSLHRSVDRTVAFVAVMKAGGVYLPIDPSLPRERAQFMATDADISALISDDPLHLTGDFPVISPSAVTRGSELDDWSFPPPRGCDAAYVIYTSGTTGFPKGVIVEHAALYNFALASLEAFHLDSRSRISNVSSFGFDVSVGDMSMALFAGACLVMPTDAESAVGPPLGRFILQTAITHLSVTPSMLSTLPMWKYPALSHIIVAGEACPQDLAARWMVGRRFFNAYGPTEATIFSTFEECLPSRQISIGKPLQNTAAYILDANQQLVRQGGTGELWLSGRNLARGYLKAQEIADSRFRDISVDGQKIRAYRTGDLALMLADGRIQFLGRADNQLKLRGFRIEPDEIEIALRTHSEIADAAVALRRDSANLDKLVAYVVPTGDRVPTQKEIGRFLAKTLPSYMIPSSIIEIKELPLTINGKLDRASLPQGISQRSSEEGIKRRAPMTATELMLVGIMQRELAIDCSASIRTSFSALPLDSLQTGRFFLAVEAQCNVQLPTEAFTDADTIEMLALYVDRCRLKLIAPPNADDLILHSIIRKQMGYLSAWKGTRLSSDSLICSLNGDRSKTPIFWCCQGSQEHESLGAALGPLRPLHGMRSGYLIFRYTSDNIKLLARRYAAEMAKLQPNGSFYVGGNCQGGMIAHQIALDLRAKGRHVALLWLLGQTRFLPYDGAVHLIFADASRVSPYRTRRKDADRLLKAAYGKCYTVSIIPGDHDNSFVSPNIESLASVLVESMDNIALQKA